MKISHRLVLQSTIAGLSLISVVALSMVSLRMIDADLAMLIERVTPLKNAITQSDAATERVVSATLDLARARDEQSLATALSALGTARTEQEALLEQAASLDGNRSVESVGLGAYGDRVQSLVEQRLAQNEADRQASTDASGFMQRTKSSLPRVFTGARMLGEREAAKAVQIQTEIAALVRDQRDLLVIRVLLKDAESIAYATNGIKDIGALKGLQRRSRNDGNKLQSYLDNDRTAAKLAKAGISDNLFKTWFADRNNGLFRLRGLTFGEDWSAARRFSDRFDAFMQQAAQWHAATDKLLGEVDAKIEALQQSRDNSTQQASDASGVALAAAIQQSLARAEDDLSSALIAPDAETLSAAIASMSTQIASVIGDTNKLAAAFRNNGFRPYSRAAGRVAKAAKQWQDAASALESARLASLATEDKLQEEIEALRSFVLDERKRNAGEIALVDQRQRDIETRVDTGVNRTLVAMTVVAALAISALIFLSWAMIRSIKTRLDRAVALARDVADGNLHPIAGEMGKDEIGQLMSAMGTMVERLTRAVSRIRESSLAVRRSVQEISTGNIDLTNRTGEQASHLNETAASMAQVATIASAGAHAAESAAERSQSANAAALQGQEIMARAMSTMSSVQTGAEEIKNIIEVINSIAFQTNILALNAAVEAARAGEQGRGFAVVASEVRSLASKSADAAQEIGRIITSNVEHVSEGSALVSDAGQHIASIADEVSQTVALIDSISTGSVEQSAAVAEVNETIQGLEHSTQQNASLAEQISQSSESLVEQAELLDNAVATFRITSA